IQPVQAVTAVRVYDPDDMPTTVNSETYSVDVLSEPARLVLSAGAVQLSPARLLNAFEVAFTAGYGDEATDVPAPIRHALKLLVAHWFEHREPVVLGELPQEVPATVAGLLLPYRRVRL
ncbi:MAG TPA: head-tail connector protein, partial [Methyloceanibacter sp.]|nr:head-tail connector protein [Methyloceanibacter sp.]